MTGKELLELPMGAGNDGGADTLRDYLQALLETLVLEGDSFSGKRPFGNSAWYGELFYPFVAKGLVKADEDGYPVDDENGGLALDLILRAIRAL
jgi:hypothetical protein